MGPFISNLLHILFHRSHYARQVIRLVQQGPPLDGDCCPPTRPLTITTLKGTTGRRKCFFFLRSRRQSVDRSLTKLERHLMFIQETR